MNTHNNNNTVRLSGLSQLKATLSAVIKPPVSNMFFLGFSAGLPLLLIFGTLSLWLSEAGLEKSSITYFSWAALGYSFKFVWAPLVDKLPIYGLTSRMGKRRSWLLVSQLSMVGAIITMAMSDPQTGNGVILLAIGAIWLGFSSATQDIVIDAYRIEAAHADYQALMSSNYIAGYRIGMMAAGAGALFLAFFLGSTETNYQLSAWRQTYLYMAALLLVGIITTLCIKEPKTHDAVDSKGKSYLYSRKDYLRFLGLFLSIVIIFISVFIALGPVAAWLKASVLSLSDNAALAGFIGASVRLLSTAFIALASGYGLTKIGFVPKVMFEQTYISPVKDFFSRYQKVAYLILLLVGLYRISDIVLGAISNIFYYDMGFSKTDIATVAKVFGLWITILGSFLGGFLSIRYGVMRVLMLGAVMTVITNLLFILLFRVPELWMLYFVISADNITGGLATGALIAYLSSLINIQFTAMQYAIFSSLMSLFPKILAGYSGAMVEALGYETFFLFASLLGVPIFVLVWLANKYTKIKTSATQDSIAAAAID